MIIEPNARTEDEAEEQDYELIEQMSLETCLQAIDATRQFLPLPGTGGHARAAEQVQLVARQMEQLIEELKSLLPVR